jgi:salicylate hydroxylase
VAEKSRLNGQYFTLKLDNIDFDRMAGDQLWNKLQLLSRTFTNNWEWAWTTTLDGSLKEAMRMLEGSS